MQSEDSFMRRKKAFKNIIIALLLQLVVVIYGFIVPKIIITDFGSEVNGLVSSITRFLGYIALLESGFGPVIKATLYKPLASKDKKKIASILKASESFFKRIALIFLVYTVVLIVVFPTFLAPEFDGIFTISLIIIISLSTFSEYFFGMTYKLFLEAKQDGYIVSLLQIISYIASVILIVVAAKVGASVQMIKLIGGLAFIVRPILQNYYVKKKYHIELNRITDNYNIKQKWDGLSQHIASVLHTSTDVVVLTIFSSLTNVSIYSVYAIVTRGLKTLVLPFSNGIESIFGDMIAKDEKDNMIKKFNSYETVYGLIVSICFTVSMILIAPFVEVYMFGVTDADYCQPLFGVLLVLGEYIWAVRQPYNNLIKAAGHFKETRRGAWVECFLNIAISVILVTQYGLIGVAIGTMVAMTVRTAEFVHYANKYILKRSMLDSIKKIILIVVGTASVMILANYLPYLPNTGYANWVLNAIMTTVLAAGIMLIAFVIFFRKDLICFLTLIKSICKRKEKK